MNNLENFTCDSSKSMFCLAILKIGTDDLVDNLYQIFIILMSVKKCEIIGFEKAANKSDRTNLKQESFEKKKP